MKSRFRLCFLLTAAALIAVPAAHAQRGDDTDRASKNGRTEATIDDVSIVIEYGRPNVRGRTIWGELVPWDKVWRTGANEATTISFSAPVAVEGDSLDAGTYALFTIPGKEKWVVVFNATAKQWGAFNHNPDEDVLRVTVTPEEGGHVESMDFVVEDSKIKLRWEKVVVPFSVAAL